MYGVSDKVLSMALSTLLVAAPRRTMAHWAEVGYSMIAVDTLAHKAGGSLRDVQLLAGHRSIQTTQRYINPQFPKTFPRFVQHAIWRYCAEHGLDVCNGNRSG